MTDNAKASKNVPNGEVKSEGIEDAEIQAALEGEPVNVMLDLQQEDDLAYYKLTEIDADHKWNIRREDKYEQRCGRKMIELMADGYIRQPLVVAKIIDATGKPVKCAPRLTCGFIRDGALRMMLEKYPEVYKERFEGKVPYRVIVCTEDDRQRAMMDHGSEELLDEFELLLAVKRYCRLGKTEKEIAVLLSPLFYQLADHKNKRMFNAKLQELKDKGHSGKAYSADQIMLEFWRRRIQNYKRIIMAPAYAEEYFKKYVDGIPGFERPSQASIERLKECANDDDVQKLLRPKLGDAQQTRGMGRAKLVDARKLVQSDHLAMQLDVILGEKEPADLIQMEEQLVQIEAAMKKNPEAFWKAIEFILRDDPKVEPKAEPAKVEPKA